MFYDGGWWGGIAVIDSCEFIDNVNRGLSVLIPDFGSLTFSNTVVAGNGVFGMFLSAAIDAVADISNCTYVNNAGPGLYVSDATDWHISNTLIAFNEFGIESDAKKAALTFDCNNVYGNTIANYDGLADQTGSNGNISIDPQFCDTTTGVYYVQATSPCAPANNSCGVLMGAGAVGCDFLRPLIINAFSPVNIWVTDPNTDYIGKDAQGYLSQTIFPADYYEEPPEYDDEVVIYYPVPGDYIIEIIAEEDAPPGSTYSIGITIDGSLQCVVILNADTPTSSVPDTVIYVVEEDWHYINGDADRSGSLNLLDVTFTINYLYKDGPEPYPPSAADADCNEKVNILDVTFLINYLYKSGSPPCNLEP